jgi:hypothetical protein
MESIWRISTFILSFTGMFICETGKAGNELFSVLEMVVVVVFCVEQDPKTSIKSEKVNRYNDLMEISPNPFI